MPNPFTISFGKKPQQYISRPVQTDQIIHTFNETEPSSQVFMIAGIRGSGKTVMLSEISDYYKAKDDWIVLNLNGDTDLIAGAVSKLNAMKPLAALFRKAEISVDIPGVSVSVHGAEYDMDTTLQKMLAALQKKGKRVLFLIDEISKNAYTKVFSGNFQIYMRENYPVYLIMAGLYDNISDLQNDKTLTFLYRAPKIFLDPLSIPAIAASYQTIFHLSAAKAMEMARLTNGYPFAYQVLGYLKYEMKGSEEDLLRKYDEYLGTYVYEKVWDELSPTDRKVVRVIADGHVTTNEIRTELGFSSQMMNVYRKRLMNQGIVNGSRRGELTLQLPRFAEFVEMYGIE